MGGKTGLKAGDIFAFELDAERLGIGQIIESEPSLYVTVLREPLPRGSSPAGIRTGEILLCGRTTDALFFHGRWRVIGNLPIPHDLIPKPCTKVTSAGEQWISDFHGRLIRRATPREWERLEFRAARSPIAFEKAYRAHHGLDSGQCDYADLGIDHVRRQAEVCSL